MMEYDVAFEEPDDEMDKLRADYEMLSKEYIILYNALMGHLEESKAIKRHMMDRYVKDSNDLDMTITSIKTARKRALKETEPRL
jgi:hypothetical protein